jgi:hypothetical protein
VKSVDSSRRPFLLATLLLSAIVYGATLASLPVDTFWVTDNGNRFIQAESLLRSGFSTLAIEYPARPIDPQLHFFPTGGFHFLILGERVYSFYSPLFSLLAAPLLAVGPETTRLLPLAGGLASIVIVFLLARANAVPAAPAALLAALASPIWFYSVVFWEHTLALALGTGALLLLMGAPGRREAIAAGLMLAAAALLREEAYLLGAGVGAAMLLSIPKRRVLLPAAISAATVLLPAALLNLRAWGHPLGLHAAIYNQFSRESADVIGEKLSNYYVYLLEWSPNQTHVIVSMMPLLLLAAAGVLPRSRATDLTKAVALLLFGLTATAIALFLWQTADPLRQTLYFQGLFGAFPLAAIFLLSSRSLWSLSEEFRFMMITLLVASVLTLLLLNQQGIGIIWGPRHFLGLVPLLVVLALSAMRLASEAAPALVKRILWSGFSLVAAASFAIQLHGIWLLESKTRHMAVVLDTARSSAAPVVMTDVFWLPEELGALFYEKPILYVSTEELLRSAISRTAAVGVRKVLFITSPEFGQIPRQQLRPIAEASVIRRRIDARFSMLNLEAYEFAPEELSAAP